MPAIPSPASVISLVRSGALGSLKLAKSPAISPRPNPFKIEPKVPIRDFKTFQIIGEKKFAGFLFASHINKHLMHLDSVRYLASIRAGLASTKDRGEVRGSGRKIHPQKGTGKARAGTSRAPHRRGGTLQYDI